MEMFASGRFLRAYRKGSWGIQRLAEGAVHDFVRRYRSDGRTVLRLYDRVAGIPLLVLEIKIDGGDRLLARFDSDQLTLLDVGPHETVSQYSMAKLDQDLRDRTEAPDQFWPERQSGFFYVNPDMSVKPYGKDLCPDWVYWLDEAQDAVQRDIYDDDAAMDAVFGGGASQSFIIVGGPGTGKTCILLNLLKLYAGYGLRVGLMMDERLVDYVEQSTHESIPGYPLGAGYDSSDVDVLLVDDPSSTALVTFYARRALSGTVKLVVQAFDPLQLSESMSDSEFHALVESSGARVLELSACYRQKANVGQATKTAADVIAQSTPFSRRDKIDDYRDARTAVTKLANELSFPNPGGYVSLYEHPTGQSVLSEVNRINRPGLLWEHWYSLLVVEPRAESLTKFCYDTLNKVRALIITEGDISTVKGLEFQHVFLFLDRELFEQLQNGFTGIGQRVYSQRRLLRIPISRARDSLVTFVLG